ncbi:hypothetical protein OAK75_08380 [Bacteriovoracales bacterium]|nr:hypothetical protein [Bacteriovoracales bacterium]
MLRLNLFLFVFLIVTNGLSSENQNQEDPAYASPCQENESSQFSLSLGYFHCVRLEEETQDVTFEGKTYKNLRVAKTYNILNARKEVPYDKNLVFQESDPTNAANLRRIIYTKTKFREKLFIDQSNFDQDSATSKYRTYLHLKFIDESGKVVGELIEGRPFDFEDPFLDTFDSFRETSHTTNMNIFNKVLKLKVGNLELSGRNHFSAAPSTIARVDDTLKKLQSGQYQRVPGREMTAFLELINDRDNVLYRKKMILYNKNGKATVYFAIDENSNIKLWNLDGSPLR